MIGGIFVIFDNILVTLLVKIITKMCVLMWIFSVVPLVMVF
jgi:hypothetical protein